MIETTIIAMEHRAVEVLRETGLFQEVTRRRVGTMATKTNWYEANIVILPEEARASLLGGSEVTLSIAIEVAGRGTNATGIFDGVRFRSDMALERFAADPSLASLLAQQEDARWQRHVESDKGATVIVESVDLQIKLRYTVGVGQLQGANMAMHSGFGAGTAHAENDSPVVYHQGLDTILLAPATVNALFAGATGDSGQRLALCDADGSIVEEVMLLESAGIHVFSDVPTGEYTLHIRDPGTIVAQSPIIRVVEAPSAEETYSDEQDTLRIRQIRSRQEGIAGPSTSAATRTARARRNRRRGEDV